MTGIEIVSSKLLILMVVGGVFALFALYLMVRLPGEGAARLEMFGLKFEASSAAILVFLVGAGLLTLPFWVQERPALRAVADGNGSSATDGGPRAVRLPPGPDTQEIEPNDDIRSAKQIGLGQRLRGLSDTDVNDGYVIPLGFQMTDVIEFKLKNAEGNITADVYDSRERLVGGLTAFGDGAYYEELRAGPNERIYVRISSYGEFAYEFSAALKEAS